MKNMLGLLPLTATINGRHRPLTNAAALPECQRLAATIVEDELELVATIVDKRVWEGAMDAYK